jgi:hypothetical protein
MAALRDQARQVVPATGTIATGAAQPKQLLSDASLWRSFVRLGSSPDRWWWTESNFLRHDARETNFMNSGRYVSFRQLRTSRHEQP